MGEIRKSGNVLRELVEAKRLPRSFIKQEDVIGLVSDKTESIEIVKMHELGVIHDLISL